MTMVEDKVNENLGKELRRRFLEEIDSTTVEYDKNDIERVKNDDLYCTRFILHKKGNLDEAFLMLKGALSWRKEFDVKGITEETIPTEFFTAKAVFPYNKDREGNSIIMLLVRYHKKVPEYATDLRRFLVYWIEKMEIQTNGGHMTVIMNCTDAGLGNLDLDLIKFLITLFRCYYPYSLAYILIYEMPWIFNAAWKLIKSWLPEDTVEKIKFVNRTSVLEYVDKENLSLEMGGTDTHEYEPTHLKNDLNSNSIVDKSSGSIRKRVHFSHRNGNSKNLENAKTGGPIFTSGIVKRSPSQEDASHLYLTDEFCIVGGMLKISPACDLVFPYSSDENESTEVTIKLTCIAEKAVAYKVKTNNIESYRVKPSIGVVEPGSTIDILVFLVSGYQPLPTDKFLIMAMEVSDASISMANLSQLWKNSSGTSSPVITDHKLRCVAGSPLQDEEQEGDIGNMIQNLSVMLTNLGSKVDHLELRQNTLQSSQNITLYLLTFLTVMFVVHMISISFF